MNHPERMEAILAWMRRHPNRLGMPSDCLQCWISAAGLWPAHWSARTFQPTRRQKIAVQMDLL